MKNKSLNLILVLIVFLLMGPFVFSGTTDSRRFNSIVDFEERMQLNEAASCFSAAHAGILKFLKCVELSDYKPLDYTESLRMIDDALENVRAAGDLYRRFLKVPDFSVMDNGAQYRLVNFDYEACREKYSFNRHVFNEVRSYLEKGNSRGVYLRLLGDVERIEDLLEAVKVELKQEKSPELKNLWRLGETCAVSTMFRQYADCILREAR